MNIQIIFSTEVGTTKGVAESLAKLFLDQHHQVKLYQAGKQPAVPDLTGYEMVVFGAPTYNDGQLETRMAELLKAFAPDLSVIKVAVFSLGDSNYPQFCGSATFLESWVLDHGGRLQVPTLKIDAYPKNEQITAWAKQLLGG